MKENDFIDFAINNILNKQGREALDAWTTTVTGIKNDVGLIKKIHSSVGKHLAAQIEKTFRSTRG